MLSEKMYQQLNKQINLEFFSSNYYLQMSAWCSANTLDGCATFLRDHANEEMTHMTKLFDYITETGKMPILGTIEEPPYEFKDIEDVFRQTLEHERVITKAINELADTAFKEKDYSTFSFLQWYISEQHEEEMLFQGIVDKIKMIGTDNSGLFFIDKEVAKLSNGTAVSVVSE